MAGQAPLVTSITPSSGPDSGGTAVTIGGLHFTDGPLLLVLIGGLDVTASAVVVSDIAITAVTAAHAAATVDIDVTTTIGSGLGNQLYTYTASGGGPVMATVYSVERTNFNAGIATDARRIEGAKIEMRMLTYTAAALASGSVIEGIPIYKGEIPISFLLIHAGLGTVTLDIGITGGDTNALLDAYSAASPGVVGPPDTGLDAGTVAGTLTAGSSGSLGIVSTVDDTIDILTGGLGTATGKLILMIWFSTLP